MKKLFIAAMALATIVSCSKDDAGDAVLTSKMKSVTVTIQNSKLGSRAEVDGTKINVTAQGGEAEETLLAEDNELVASAGQLDILFANNAGVILKAMDLVNQNGVEEHPAEGDYVAGEIDGTTYTFHRVPEQVTRVAVVRLQPNDISIEEGSTTLEQVLAKAQDEKLNLQRSTQEIVLYAEDNLAPSTDCYVDEENNLTYYYYTADLIVTPQFARVELVNVTCDDLGALNADDDDVSFSYDELTIKKFSFGNYTKTWEKDNILYGEACDEYKEDGSTKALVPADGMAWSWNIATQTVPAMTLELDVAAHDWNVNNKEKTVSIKGLTKTKGSSTTDVTTFDRGNVYRIALNFNESHIDETDDALCVKATVEIKNWTIVPVFPVFGN